MTTTDAAIVAAARADAMKFGLSRAGREDQAPDPTAAHRDAIAALSASWAPSANVAAALLTSAYQPVALDRDRLTVSSEPLTTLERVLRHYSSAPADGVGLLGGQQLNGEVLVGLRTSPRAWADWLRATTISSMSWVDDEGRTQAREHHIGHGSPVFLRWAPPPAQARTIVAFGGAQIREAAAALTNDHDRALERSPVMAPWALAAVYTFSAGSPVPSFRSRRLTQGVELLGDGAVLPWHVRRPDGWQLNATRLPVAVQDSVPAWLADTLGAKWSAK